MNSITVRQLSPYLFLWGVVWIIAMAVILLDLNEGTFHPTHTPLLLWYGLRAAAFFLIPGTIAFLTIYLLQERLTFPFVLLAVIAANLVWGVIGYYGIFEFLFFPDLEFRNALVFPVILAGAGLAVRYASQYIQQMRNLAEAKQRQVEAETKILTLQLIPHTLFNMLNTAYSIVQEDQEQGTNYILNLANLMRHLTHSADRPWSPASEELDFIRSFVELEKPRASGVMEVRFQIEGDTGVPVPAILFVTLFENAMKHGWGDNGSVMIEVKFNGREDGFDFELSNSIPPFSRNAKASNLNGLNVGLENVRRRLELLYPDQHEFTARKVEDFFIARVNVFSQ